MFSNGILSANLASKKMRDKDNRKESSWETSTHDAIGALHFSLAFLLSLLLSPIPFYMHTWRTNWSKSWKQRATGIAKPTRFECRFKLTRKLYFFLNFSLFYTPQFSVNWMPDAIRWNMDSNFPLFTYRSLIIKDTVWCAEKKNACHTTEWEFTSRGHSHRWNVFASCPTSRT